MVKMGFIHGEVGLVPLPSTKSNTFVTSEIPKFAISAMSLKLNLKLYLT